MKNIFSIFSGDLKGIVKHFFVLVVTLGLCVLPALYAWFNIYANWDPYNNTGNIRLAAAIEDAGWTDADGNYYNLGEEVRKDLEKSASISWVFVDSDQDAQEGVRSGAYYAAISIDKSFSENMFKDFSEKKTLPELNYYLNGKKNAVATKVTDTAVGSVQNSINEKYISLMTKRMFGDIQDDISESDTQSDIQKITNKLNKIKANLDSYNKMIETLSKSNKKLSKVLKKSARTMDKSKTRIEEGSGKLYTAASGVSEVKNSFNEFNGNVTAVLDDVRIKIEAIADGISSAQLQQDAEAVKTYINDLHPLISDLNYALDVLLDAVMAIDAEDIPWKPAAREIQNLQTIIVLLEENTTKVAAVTAAEQLADSASTSLQAVADGIAQAEDMFTYDLVPSMNQVIDSLRDSLNALGDVLTNLSAASGTLSDTILKMNDTINTLNDGLPQTQEILTNVSNTITDLIDKINEAAESEKLKLATAFFSGDAAALGNFFAEPVVIEDHNIFDIANYGSGVAPFYSALAIWVGMTILVSILKVHPKQKAFPEAKRRELFFGRYLTFLLLSLIQTAIIVIGEFVIFKVQCLYPGLFVLAAAAASLTISLIVYSLVVSFGDIGKAIAIIMLVIQIAGSGGTYPIEILPSFFRSIYLLFPFPYIINAMRECIGGMYGSTYLQCLVALAVFCAIALVLGLLIRIPFISINKFMEKRAEETKIL